MRAGREAARVFTGRRFLAANIDDRRDAEPGPQSLWLRSLPLILLCGATAIVVATGAYRYLSVEALAAHRDTLRALVASHPWTAPLAFWLVYVAAVALSLPGAALLTVVGGFLFGWAAGTALTVTAATSGAVLVFLAARTSLAGLLRRNAGQRLDRFASGFRDGAFSYLLFLRLVPVFPFWLVNLAAALLGVPLGTFTTATLIGIVPGTAAFSVAGAGFDDIIARQGAAQQACVAAGRGECGLDLSLGTLLTPGLVATLGALAVLSLIPVLLKRLWRPA